MGSMTINLRTAPTLTNLVTTSMDQAIKLRWDEPVDSNLWGAEVWASNTNNRSTASLVQVVTGNSYIYTTTGSETKYFWVRSKSTYGATNGAWEPTGSTSGVVGISGDIAGSLPTLPGGGTASASVSSGSSTLLQSITNYGQWYEVASAHWTAPDLGTVTAYCGVYCTSSGITGGSVGDSVTVRVRMRLYDNTTAADVVGGTSEFKQATYSYENVPTTAWYQIIPDQCIQQSIFYNSDLMGHMIGGHVYYLYVEVMKERTVGTTQTLTVNVSTAWAKTQTGATYG